MWRSEMKMLATSQELTDLLHESIDMVCSCTSLSLSLSSLLFSFATYVRRNKEPLEVIFLEIWAAAVLI